MKKPLTALTSLMTFFCYLSIFLFFATMTFLWELVCRLQYFADKSIVEEIVNSGPIIPVGDSIDLFGCLAVIFILFASSNSKKYVTIEILLSIFLILVLPPVSYFAQQQQAEMSYLMGLTAPTRLGIASEALIPSRSCIAVTSGLCLITCGIRIVEKINYKNQLKELANTESVGK